MSLGVAELEAGERAAGPGAAARRRPQAGRRDRPGAGAGAAGAGGAGGAGRPDVAAAVDGEVDPHAGRRADPPGAQVSARTRSGTCCARGVQPAGQRQDHRGKPAPGPGRPVPLHQRAGPGLPGGRGPGDQRGRQEEGDGRRVRQRRAGSGGRRGTPAASATTTSPAEAEGKAIPYGIYDLAANAGWVSVGTDHDTAAFAVESIRRWWNARGRADYPARGGC